MTKTYEKFIMVTSALFRNLARQTPNILYYEQCNDLQKSDGFPYLAFVFYGICSKELYPNIRSEKGS